MKKIIKIILISIFTINLAACNSGFFDKDNTPNPTPLTAFRPEIKTQLLWDTKIGKGANDEYIKLVPAVAEENIYAANFDGTLTAVNKITGKQCWKVTTLIPITSGPVYGEGIIIVASRKGDVVALNQNGGRLWQIKLDSEILAPAAISNGIALVKTIEGKLFALSLKDGHELWQYEQAEPLLILRGSSAPQIKNNIAIAGFANGTLAKLALNTGDLFWQRSIALPEGAFIIQRMIDIDADPIILNNRVYAATYQGRIAALHLHSGEALWTHDISSYTGIAADETKVFVSDARSHVWAFNANTGEVIWRQNYLEARNISGPVIMQDFIVVGDCEGYLHWLSKQDGHFIARTRTRGTVLATPIVDNNILYVLTQNGHLAAYTYG